MEYSKTKLRDLLGHLLSQLFGAFAYRTLNQSQVLSDIIAPSKLMISGGFTIFFTSTTERDKFLANTQVAIRIIAAGSTIIGSSKWKIDQNIYAAKYKDYPYTEEQGLLAAKVQFEGEYSVADSKDYQVAITNQDVSY